ncbi:MAG: glycosyltransferase family 9 protein [Planctomycetes bacterium]|nr:glycosyltransferase family 9 protein [Planctomycetota bacterium]
MSTLDARRIYVRLPNWVGDVVLATPFLRRLRAAAPDAEIVLHGKGVALRLLEPESLADRHVGVVHKGLLGPWREGRRLRADLGEIDLAFLLPNSLRSALTVRAAGARRIVGYRNGRSLLVKEGPFVEKEGLFRSVPMIDYYLGLLEAVGVDCQEVPRRPVLSAPPIANEWAEEFLTRQSINAPGLRLWAINLGGSWETKRWIPEHAGRLVRLLRRRGITPILLRGPDEQDLADQTCAAAGERIPGADEVVGLNELTSLLRRCRVLITTDSGPRHFGIAAGIPVLVLIGSTHPGYTAVDYPALELACEEVSCWPCHLKVCPLEFRCMRALTAERVADQAARLVGRQLTVGVS